MNVLFKFSRLSLVLITLNFVFITPSCAQDGKNRELPPNKITGCLLLAYEARIDALEQIIKELKGSDFISIWDNSNTNLKRPSQDLWIKKSCEELTPIDAETQKEIRKESELLYNQLLKLFIDKIEIKNQNKSSNNNSSINQSNTNNDEVIYNEEKNSNNIEDDVDNYSYMKLGGYDDKKDFESFTKSYGPKNKKYSCVIFDPMSRVYTMDFLWKGKLENKEWQLIRTYDRAIKYLKTELNKTPEMLLNAGIFDADLKPLGLFIRKGQKPYSEYNSRKEKDGNFYLDPAGVFVCYKKGSAEAMTTNQFEIRYSDSEFKNSINFATQSGPMLVVDGKLHPKFDRKSKNSYIRNGVGVLPNGKILFVISEQPVTFYEFAMFFLMGFDCSNALYLDGAISKMYTPSIGKTEKSGEFAGIIAIYKK